VQDTPCIPLNEYSRAGWKLAVDPPAGARFRLRYDVAGDDECAAARAPWVNLRFTSPAARPRPPPTEMSAVMPS
jgi:hypothetical protein